MIEIRQEFIGLPVTIDTEWHHQRGIKKGLLKYFGPRWCNILTEAGMERFPIHHNESIGFRYVQELNWPVTMTCPTCHTDRPGIRGVVNRAWCHDGWHCGWLPEDTRPAHMVLALRVGSI